jgi:uncharacterized membrane protein YuzA (DUF378 family)
MKIIKMLAFILVIIGALNWGLVGVFHFDLVASLFGEMSILSRIIYSLVGGAGLILLFTAYDLFTNEV